MRLLPSACHWCHGILWPWQPHRYFLGIDHPFHLRCWLAIAIMQDQEEVTGV